MMEEQQRQLILALASRKISETEFLQRYPVDPRANPDHIVELLERADEERSQDDVECGLLLAFRFGIPGASAPVLNRLLVEDWHYQHENIAMALQRLKDPSSVDSLYQAAQSRHAYLDYDEAYALAVKCVWALGDIGSDEALDKLQRLAESDNPIIHDAALHQLSRLHK